MATKLYTWSFDPSSNVPASRDVPNMMDLIAYPEARRYFLLGSSHNQERTTIEHLGILYFGNWATVLRTLGVQVRVRGQQPRTSPVKQVETEASVGKTEKAEA